MSNRAITTRQIRGKWSAHCGCGGYWSGLKDTEAEAIAWIEGSIATGNCQCRPAAAEGNET